MEGDYDYDTNILVLGGVLAALDTGPLCFRALLVCRLSCPGGCDGYRQRSGGEQSQTLPGTGGAFDLTLPLTKNAVNTITVTATDGTGNTASQEIKVTQLSLNQIVVSQVTAERLSVQQIKQLVRDGVINLDNPANYNVSKFDIVLTIGNQPVPLSVTIPILKDDLQTGYEIYRMPSGEGSGGGGKPNAGTSRDRCV